MIVQATVNRGPVSAMVRATAHQGPVGVVVRVSAHQGRVSVMVRATAYQGPVSVMVRATAYHVAEYVTARAVVAADGIAAALLQPQPQVAEVVVVAPGESVGQTCSACGVVGPNEYSDYLNRDVANRSCGAKDPTATCGSPWPNL